jgi:hypothetical protein
VMMILMVTTNIYWAKMLAGVVLHTSPHQHTTVQLAHLNSWVREVTHLPPPENCTGAHSHQQHRGSWPSRVITVPLTVAKLIDKRILGSNLFHSYQWV